MSVLCKDSVHTAQSTHSNSVIKSNWLMLYKARVSVYSEMRTNHITSM